MINREEKLVRDLSGLLEPKTIAVVGASENLAKPGGRAVRYLQSFGFKGKIIPINPGREYIAGLKCHKDIRDINEKIDLAIISLPAELVCNSLKNCQIAGVDAAVVYSSGFSEIGPLGSKIEIKLRDIIFNGETLVCGPNSQGIANFHQSMVAYFSSELKPGLDQTGPIGFAGHSGVMGGIVANECIDRGIGMGFLVSLGNEIDVSIADIINYGATRKKIKVIGAYIECVNQAEKLRESIIFARSQGVYVVLLKGGRDEVGLRAAASHTAALAGNWNTHCAALRQWGAVVVEDIETLIDALELLSLCNIPTEGKNIGLLTNSGGIGVLCADALGSVGLSLPNFSAETEKNLSKTLPSFGSPKNPADVTLKWLTNPSVISKQLQVVAEDQNIDIVIPFPGVIRQHTDKITEQIGDANKLISKPMIAGWFGGDPEGPKTLRKLGVPVYRTPKQLAHMANILCEQSLLNQTFEHEAFFKYEKYNVPVINLKSNELHELIGKKRGSLSEYDSRTVLSHYGIPMAKYKHSKDIKTAVAAAESIGYPVALKISSSDIIHKAQSGGVLLNLRSSNDVALGANEILERVKELHPLAKVDGFLIEEMIPDSIELIVGMKRDPVFGPVVTVGTGGSMVELLSDYDLLVPPFNNNQVIKALNTLRIESTLNDSDKVSSESILQFVEIVRILGELSLCLPEIIEVDINPIKIGLDKCVAVDSVVIVS
tara:strand:- start:2360 stop:4504 length:2145 start_codon:yes stop_codon:yes gene_type:complete